MIFAQTPQSARVAEIQAALQKAGLGGWLFYDFRNSDIGGQRILKIEGAGGSRPIIARLVTQSVVDPKSSSLSLRLRVSAVK